MAKYLVRFDDINSRMDWDKFFIIKNCLEKYNIKAILGVVPDCRDDFLMVSKPLINYYCYLRECKSYGDSIAQHGYKHKYDTKVKGFFGSSSNSEFAGHSRESQFEKLVKGKEILKNELLWEPIFMAPSHSFDLNTLKVLKELNFSIVLDGFSLFPFKVNNLIFIPQIASKPLPRIIPCISQLCIHINNISNKDLKRLIYFIETNHKDFTSIEDIEKGKKYPRAFERFIINLLIRIYRKCRTLVNIINSEYIIQKVICLFQRIHYRFKLRNIKIKDWHLNGTFYCRTYKLLSLELINSLNPKLYIDLGCGLGEILSKVKLPKSNKIGFDKDNLLRNAINKINKNKFIFFEDESLLIEYAKVIRTSKKDLVVISMLNFIHDLSLEELKAMINKYHEELGEYILLIDNIFSKSKVYKYNHHEFLFNHIGLIKYSYKVDKLRSLYCIRVG